MSKNKEYYDYKSDYLDDLLKNSINRSYFGIQHIFRCGLHNAYSIYSSTKIIIIGDSQLDEYKYTNYNQILFFYTGIHCIHTLKSIIDYVKTANKSLTVFANPQEFDKIRQECGNKHYKLNGTKYFSCNILGKEYKDIRKYHDVEVINYTDRVQVITYNWDRYAAYKIDELTIFKS